MKKFLFILFALLLIAGCSKEEIAKSDAKFSKEPKVGVEAADFYVRDMNNKVFQLSKERGRVVIVYFWRMSCKECIPTMITLNKLYEEFKDNGLIVLAVNAENMHSAPISKVYAIIEENKFTFRNIRDDEGLVAEAFGVLKASQSYVIDKNGKFVYMGVGDESWFTPARKKMVVELMGG